MHLEEVGLGIPPLDGWQLHTHIQGDAPRVLELWFFRHVDALVAIENILLCLFNANWVEADLQASPFFPPLAAHNLSSEGLMQRLHLSFASGHISFTFEKAAFSRWLQPVAALPNRPTP